MDQGLDGSGAVAPVLADQGEGGAGDRALDAEGRGEALGEGRLARAEVPDEEDGVARRADPGQAGRDLLGPRRRLGFDDNGPTHQALMNRLARTRSAHFGQGLAAGAQDEGRVVGRDEMPRAERIDRAAQLADALGAVEEQPGGEVAQGDHDRRADERDLLLEVGAAGLDLAGSRIPVLGGAALDHVGDVALGPCDPDLLEHEAVEEFARAPDEGLALQVFLVTRALADEEEGRPGVAHPEDDLGATRGQRALGAAEGFGAQPFPRRPDARRHGFSAAGGTWSHPSVRGR